MTRRHLHIPDQLWSALSARAAAEGVPVAEVVRRVLAEWAVSQAGGKS